jgi:hypothetical protein
MEEYIKINVSFNNNIINADLYKCLDENCDFKENYIYEYSGNNILNYVYDIMNDMIINKYNTINIIYQLV